MATGQARASRYRPIVAEAHLPDGAPPQLRATGVGGQGPSRVTYRTLSQPIGLFVSMQIG